LVQIQGINSKLLLSMFSLLLLALVSYSGSFLQKGLAASEAHIVASGDWHCGVDSNAEKTVDNAMSMNPDLILGLGDYSDDETGTCWVNLTRPVDSITKISLGNHDGESDGLLNSYLNHYGLSKQFYSFDIKNVHVLTMSTEDKFEANSEQYNFVVNDLRNSANNPSIKWIIVNVHYPFYSSPNGCEDSDCAGNEELREIYHPLFDKYGVDLVLQAHARNYQRSFPLEFNQESPSKPIVISTSKGEYNAPGGIIFAIVGTGGGELKHPLDGQSAFMAYQQDSKFGIIDMHFSDNKLDARFVANDGSTMDHFSIAKTVKKKVIERISDDTVTDNNVIQISYKDTTKVNPLAEKQTISYKDTTKANPLAEKQTEQDKPSITFKLDDDATTNTKANPLAEKQTEQPDKPVMTTKLGNDPPTDDKSISPGEEKVDLSEKEKSTSFQSSDNVDKSHVQDLPEVSNSEEVKTIDTNQRDPFGTLN
jgi:hypothetical protein